MLLLGATPAVLASQIILSGQSAQPGASVLLPVAFAAQSSSVSGLQFDIQYDNSALSLAVTLGDPALTSGKDLYLADIAPNRKRVLIAGLNQNSIADGTLVNLFVRVGANTPSGVYALNFSGVCATDPSGRSVPITSSGGALTINASSQGVSLPANGVLNAGSFLPGPVAPGELITLSGSGIGPSSAQQPAGSASSTVLGGTSVLFDGTPAPLLYAGANQINAVAPFALSGKTSTQLKITAQGQAIAGVTVSVTSSSPAIFTLDSSGIGQGAILNQDSTVNSASNPATKGSIVAIYATGAGQTNPASTDGQITGSSLPTPLLPASVQIGGQDAKVVYAGAAPGLIAGVVQINATIPANAPSGPAVPIVLRVGTVGSQAGVTVAIQ